MKRMKHGFVPMPNNAIRITVKGPAGVESEIYQTTTLAEVKMITVMVKSRS